MAPRNRAPSGTSSRACSLAELINPSPKLWLFFAWISDVEILDNSARQFAALEPDWPAAPIRLSQVLRALLSRGVEIRVIIREHGHNDYFTRTPRGAQSPLWRPSEMDDREELPCERVCLAQTISSAAR